MAGRSPTYRKTRILFVAEAVTLAHIARPISLARSLDANLFDVHIAHHPRYRDLLGDIPFFEHTIESITPDRFMKALAAGSPLYDFETLTRYVEEDLNLLATVRPDMVVGDFRLSLSVSARLAGVPYVALCNAYWSPYCQQTYVVPDLPLTRMLGPTLAQLAFTMVRPFAFALHSLPMWRLRRKYGLASLGFDLRRVYTDADVTLYADAPHLYRMLDLPPHHRFLGPIDWSPSFPAPRWWDDIVQGRPIVYVTLGSSGNAALLPELIEALGQLELTAMVSTAGAPLPTKIPENVYVATYLPGDQCISLASLIICNGGSPSSYQALLRGVPVVGVATNLDQFLNMAGVVAAGAGRVLRSGTLRGAELAMLVKFMLADGRFAEAARAFAKQLAAHDSMQQFSRIVEEVALGQSSGPKSTQTI